MTRTDVMASSRPLTDAVRTHRKSLHGGRSLLLLAVLALIALALAMPAAAAAAGTSTTEGTSKYNTEPEKPKEGTSPSKESTEPAKEKTEPAKEKTSTPSTTSTSPSSEKASTLPFTGLDLRWVLAFGLVLMGAGFSILVVQRRHRRQQR